MAMKLIKHNFKDFPYHYMIKFEEGEGINTTVEEASNWADEVGIDCIVCAGETYCRTEQDALAFMLRWH